MARTEVRKECPSCGLGVPLEAKVCEFCGWDFEEEDEWISQIEKLEQELITEKQKFEDTSVDRMIQSTLRSPTLEKEREEAPAPESVPVVVKKKVLAKGSGIQVKITKPLMDEGAEEPMDEEELEDRRYETPAASKPKPVSIKIGVSKIPPPPADDLDLELEELVKREEKAFEGVESAERPEKAEAAPAVASGKKTTTRRVRRVVSRPSGTPGAKPSTGAAPAKPSAPATVSPTPSASKPSPAKPAAAGAKERPSAPAKPAPSPEKEEKKGLFGKMFGGEKEEKKPEAKPAPAKVQPSKQPAPGAKKGKEAEAQKPAVAPVKPSVKMFQCPLCNTMVREDDKTCPNCGAEFE